MKRVLFAAACVSAVLAACGTMSTGAAAPIAKAAMTQTAPPVLDFVKMAGASDLYEIQSSQLVMQTTPDPALRRFAEMMVEHHTLTTATLTRAAQSEGLTPPPPMLDAPKTAMIRELQAATGVNRDVLYKQQQVMAHREALTLHASFAETGEAPALKAAAAAAVPIVSRHYNMIVAMEGGSDAAQSPGSHSGT